MQPSSLYIHIPYCRRKCIYCDFYSGGARIADWERYTAALLSELKTRCSELSSPVCSIYLGGGTPSMMPPAHIKMLMNGIGNILRSRQIDISYDCEITLEANPEDVNDENVELWRELGITRISLGVQTFSDDLLRRIGRSHTSDDALRALRLLCEAFENVSGDLMFGLPGQSVEQVCSDAWRMIDCGVEHLSAYSLMYEEGTALTALRDAGRLTEADDATSSKMFDRLSSILMSQGFEQYEISNYARPGFRSRHNSGYWSGRPYLGLGASAHSFDGDKVRRANRADIRGYIEHFSSNATASDRNNVVDYSNTQINFPFYSEEILTKEEQIEERIMLRLRTQEGLSLSSFAKEFGDERLFQLLSNAQAQIKRGVLRNEGDYLSLTTEGILISDSVIVSLL